VLVAFGDCAVTTNVPGMQFINTARWSFSRWIDLNEDDSQDANEYFNPLPGESGIALPMTIVAPNLVVNKTSPATAINLGTTAGFTLDVQTAGGDAWNAIPTTSRPACAPLPPTPPGSSGWRHPGQGWFRGGLLGHLQRVPVRPDHADGGPIAPEQHLIITYQAELDSGFTNDGATLTNVAGATQWFSANSTYAGRRLFARTLTDGTPTVVDFQDSQYVTAALHGYYFEKTVQNLTSLENPATTARRRHPALPAPRLQRRSDDQYGHHQRHLNWPPIRPPRTLFSARR
jgi:hypothetical protein